MDCAPAVAKDVPGLNSSDGVHYYAYPPLLERGIDPRHGPYKRGCMYATKTCTYIVQLTLPQVSASPAAVSAH